jgi:hypothetical protein
LGGHLGRGRELCEGEMRMEGAMAKMGTGRERERSGSGLIKWVMRMGKGMKSAPLGDSID